MGKAEVMVGPTTGHGAPPDGFGSVLRLLAWSEPLGRLPAWARYGATFLLVLISFGARYALSGIYPFPYLPFLPAIFLAAVLFDRSTGFFATVLSGALALEFFVEPSDGTLMTDAGHLLSLLLFTGVGIFVSVSFEATRGSMRKLNEANGTLQSMVREQMAIEEDLRTANAQNEMLLHELNHRIRNHLQSAMAGLALSRRKAGEGPEARALEQASMQLSVLHRVYDRLEVKDTGHPFVDARVFIEGLTADLSASLIGEMRVQLTCQVERVRLKPGAAVSVGLIINEGVTNALKHAFPSGSGSITVRLRSGREDFLSLEVVDDGCGLTFESPRAGFGRKLIDGLAVQLGGTSEWGGPPGTTIRVRFPAA